MCHFTTSSATRRLSFVLPLYQLRRFCYVISFHLDRVTDFSTLGYYKLEVGSCVAIMKPILTSLLFENLFMLLLLL